MSEGQLGEIAVKLGRERIGMSFAYLYMCLNKLSSKIEYNTITQSTSLRSNGHDMRHRCLC